MYTWEITNFCSQRNWIIDAEDFLDIIKRSPQICHAKLEGWEDGKAKYLIETYDGFSGTIWVRSKSC